MESSLDLVTRLSVEPEHKNLYAWSLQEFRPDGTKVGGNHIPWDWSLYFRAIGFRRIHSAGWSEFKKPPQIEERDSLKCGLESIAGEFRRPVAYSMFGSQRPIGVITLQVYRLPNGETEERCVVGGIVEWEYKEEFSRHSETVPDELYISVYLRGERFDRLIGVVGDGLDAELTLRINGVSGFYSYWSPDIKTSFIKVLTDQQHEPELPEGCKISPPVLGSVREFEVTAQRVLKAAAPVIEEGTEDEPPAPPPPTPQQVVNAVGLAVVARLDQLKYPLWGVIALLILLLIFKH